MQNRYAGDVGDFGKIAMLKALASSDLRLGVNWYLNLDEESNADGSIVRYRHLRALDQTLFDALESITTSGSRSIARLEQLGGFPSGTTFCDDPLPRRTKAFRERIGARAQWFASALKVLEATDLVFLDPDNGIATDKVSLASGRAAKYALLPEIECFHNAGQSVVIYHHQTRRKGGAAMEVQHWLDRMSALSADSFALKFSRASVRFYFVIPAPDHAQVLRRRAVNLVDTRWKEAFHIVTRAKRADSATF